MHSWPSSPYAAASAWDQPVVPDLVRLRAARGLRRAGIWLAVLARRLAATRDARPSCPVPVRAAEYCTEAGVPGGALFINGGRLEIDRL
jgi:hypothetical protein